MAPGLRLLDSLIAAAARGYQAFQWLVWRARIALSGSRAGPAARAVWRTPLAAAIRRLAIRMGPIGPISSLGFALLYRARLRAWVRRMGR